MKALLASLALLAVGCGGSLSPAPTPNQTVVFMGDSITAFWNQNGNTLPVPGAIDAGVPGEPTPNVLNRFSSDVITRHPSRVYILAGTNDALTFMSLSGAVGNIEQMVKMAEANGISVSVGTVPPVATDLSNQGPQYCCHDFNPDINSLNQQLVVMLANHPSVTVLDYHRVLAADGLPLPGVLKDGVHPTAIGYQMMDAVVH